MGKGRINYVTSRPHYRLTMGHPDEIECPPKADNSVEAQLQRLCIGRTAVEGDRLPRKLAEKLQKHGVSELWLRSSAQIEIFHRAGAHEVHFAMIVASTRDNHNSYS